MRRFAAVLLCASSLAYAGQALAQSKAPIELKWNALESCPSADTVLARVHKIAGTTRATPNTLRADATITQPSEGLFRLRLEIRYGSLAAVRDIEGKSCKDLAGAAAVALALLLSSAEPLTENDLSGTPKATSTTGATAGGEQQEQERHKQASPNEPAKAPGAGEQKPATPPSVET